MVMIIVTALSFLLGLVLITTFYISRHFKDDTLLAGTMRGLANTGGMLVVDSACVAKIHHVLTVKERSDSLDVLLCSSSLSSLKEYATPALPPLATLVMDDRAKIRALERREYLSKLRSYRLSGLICNNQLDPDLPRVESETAFKCLPRKYRRSACMDGRMNFPKACAEFGGVNQTALYVPEPERVGEVAARAVVNAATRKTCEASAAVGISKCGEVPLGLLKGGTASGQFAAGVPEAKVLTMRSGNRPIWRREALDLHLSMIREGKDVSPLHYPGAHPAIQRAIDDKVDVKDKTAAVFGSISPWVESILHHNGVKSPTMTVDYNQPISHDERTDTELMAVMLEQDVQFDVAVSYSSIEHDGQGRYGDPLDPDGDLAAMKEAWLKVAPGGWLLLQVPVGPNDSFRNYSQRIYGPARLPLLIRGWEYVGMATSNKMYGPEEAFMLSEVPKDSSVIILRKPESVHADDLLDSSKFGGLVCDIIIKRCGMQQ